MAKQTLEVEVKGTAKDAGALGYFDRIAQKAKAIRKENRASGETALEGILRGGLGRFGAEAFGGGAALIGIDFATEAVNKLTEKTKEFRTLVSDGAGAGEIAEALAKSLPIYGDIFAAGRKLREEWSGEAEELRQQVEESERLLRITEARAAAAKVSRDAEKAHAEFMRKAQLDIANIGRDSYTSAINTFNFQRKQETDPQLVQNRLDEYTKATREAYNKRATELRAQQAAALKVQQTLEAEGGGLGIIAANVVGGVSHGMVHNPAGSSALGEAALSPNSRPLDIKRAAAIRDAAEAARQLRDAQSQYDKDLLARRKEFAAQQGITLEQLDKQLAETRKQRAEGFTRFQEDQARQVARTEAEIQAQRLRDQGKFLEAEQALIDASVSEQISTQRQMFADFAKQLGLVANDPRLKQMQTAARSAVEGQAQQREVAAKRADYIRQIDIDAQQRNRTLSVRLSLLDQSAAEGNEEARKQAERLRIDEEINDQIRERIKLLADAATPATDRDRIRTEIGALGNLRQRRQAMAEYRNQFSEFSSASFTASASPSRFNSGTGLAVKDQQMSEERSYRRSVLESLNKAATRLESVDETIKRLTNGVGVFGGTGSNN